MWLIMAIVLALCSPTIAYADDYYFDDIALATDFNVRVTNATTDGFFIEWSNVNAYDYALFTVSDSGAYNLVQGNLHTTCINLPYPDYQDANILIGYRLTSSSGYVLSPVYTLHADTSAQVTNDTIQGFFKQFFEQIALKKFKIGTLQWSLFDITMVCLLTSFFTFIVKKIAFDEGDFMVFDYITDNGISVIDALISIYNLLLTMFYFYICTWLLSQFRALRTLFKRMGGTK